MAAVVAALSARLQWDPTGCVPCNPWVTTPKTSKDTCHLRQILSFNSFLQVRKEIIMSQSLKITKKCLTSIAKGEKSCNFLGLDGVNYSVTIDTVVTSCN